MTAIAVTAAQVAAVYPDKSEIYTFIAGATITQGQLVCITIATGKLDVADANGAGNLTQLRGVALNGGAAGQAINVLKRGFVYGFTVSGVAYDAVLYLSDTVGQLDDAAGSMTVQAGRVLPLPDSPTLTKAVYFDVRWLGANWS